MARVCLGAQFTGSVNGADGTTAFLADDPYTGTLEAAVNSAVAALVADGATPTQAHVTTLNSAWTAFVAGAQDISLSVNTSNIPTVSRLRQALNKLLLLAQGTSQFTA